MLKVRWGTICLLLIYLTAVSCTPTNQGQNTSGTPSVEETSEAPSAPAVEDTSEAPANNSAAPAPVLMVMPQATAMSGYGAPQDTPAPAATLNGATTEQAAPTLIFGSQITATNQNLATASPYPAPATTEKSATEAPEIMSAPQISGTAEPTLGSTPEVSATLQPTVTSSPQISNTGNTTPSIRLSGFVLPLPAPGQKPALSQGAVIQPLEWRNRIARLTTWLDFQVLDYQGQPLGKIVDYILNTCETHVVYFVMQPIASGNANGNVVLLPFELVTVNSGVLDAQSKAIVLDVDPQLIRNAPSFPSNMALFPLDWEPTVRDYWAPVAHLSKLSSVCGIPGTNGNVHKIGYATQLLAADLYDGPHNLLGKVMEAIVEPETGNLDFFMVDLPNQGGRILIPLRAVNIPDSVLQPGGKVELVLLKDSQLLQNAPRVAVSQGEVSFDDQNLARQYWGQ